MGGLIVIDFIDMLSNKNQRDVENRLRDATQIDRARVQLGRISRFGLLEMSRQRLRPSLEETSSITCPRCSGQGTIRDTKSLALSILRLIEEESIKDRSAEIRAIVPVSVGTFLLNEKRQTLAAIEQRTGVRVNIIPTAQLETPHYDVQRLRDDEVGKGTSLSFEIHAEIAEEAEAIDNKPAPTLVRQEAAVKGVQLQQSAAPVSTPVTEAPVKRESGFLSRIMGAINNLFTSESSSDESAEKTEKPRDNTGGNRSNRNRNARGRGGRGRGRGGRDDRNTGDKTELTDNRSTDTRGANTEREEQLRNDNRQQQGQGRRNDQRGDRNQPRNDQQKNEQRQQREQREQREQRPDRNENKPQQNIAAESAETNETGSDNKPRRRPDNRRPRRNERHRQRDNAQTEIDTQSSENNGIETGASNIDIEANSIVQSSKPEQLSLDTQSAEKVPTAVAETKPALVEGEIAAAFVPPPEARYSANGGPRPSAVTDESIASDEATTSNDKPLVTSTPVVANAAEKPVATTPAPVATPAKATAPSSTSAPAAKPSNGRASNDPRLKKREFKQLEVMTEVREITPLNAPPVEMTVKADSSVRASNDPRAKRNAESASSAKNNPA
jgi:ribonuclease E